NLNAPELRIQGQANFGLDRFKDDDKNSVFTSAHASIIQETEATEQLVALLVQKKAEIDEVLDSHTVYALGPDFQQGYLVPCIACWIAEPLDTELMKKLSALFNYKFEIISYVVNKQGKLLNSELSSIDEITPDKNGQQNDNNGDK
ncbi:7502_t:CDS:1, partial [Scutellospora calospora]